MSKITFNSAALVAATLLSSPAHAMDAYAWVANSENEFFKSKFADQVKANGTDDFDSVTDRKGDIVLDCAKALYLYGGRKALKAAFDAANKTFIVQSNCDKPKKLAVFTSTVGVRAGTATKQIIMITPANSERVDVVGEEYQYKYMPDKDAKSNLYEYIGKSQLKKLVTALDK